MRFISDKEEKIRNRKRIIVLIVSGIYVIIILPIIGVFISLYIDAFFGFSILITTPFNIIIAVIFLVVGFFWAIWANIELYRMGQGSPVPFKETQTRILVIRGPYEYTRNPMVFGYILIWIGMGFFFNSLFLTLGFTSIITILLIVLIKLWEEKNLEKRFGESYVEYKKKISFIIPLPRKKQK